MYYPEDFKDMYSFFTNSRFLPATTLPELSLDCLNSFQILQIIQNFLPNELRTFFKEKLKIFELSFLARKDILKLLTCLFAFHITIFGNQFLLNVRNRSSRCRKNLSCTIIVATSQSNYMIELS